MAAIATRGAATRPRIASLWFSGPLRNIEKLCIASWLGTGHEVDIYSYGEVPGLPVGARLRDGREVLSPDYIERLKPLAHPGRERWQPLMNFSDLFRVKLMEEGRGLWLDGDVLLLRPLAFDPAVPFFAWEDWHRIGSPVFYLPEDSPFIADYNRVLDTPDLMPHWLGFRRRVLKPLLWQLRGLPYSPPDIGITIYGNDAFTRLARKHGLTRHALERRSFYAWNAEETNRFYDPAHGAELPGDPRVLGIHIHHKGFVQKRPASGSLYARALDLYAAELPDMAWQD